jgi:uncharacterized membrane protein YagU involved in acid resistance
MWCDSRMGRRRGSLLGDMLRGAIAGGVATWVMDQVTTGMLASQPPEVTEREKAARPNGQSALENLVDRVAATLDVELDPSDKATVTQGAHYGLGVVPGAAYALFRRRLPFVGAGRGILYGFLLWAVNDEYLATRLGIAGPPEAYPPETHLRGLVGHLVLGVATDTGIDILGG